MSDLTIPPEMQDGVRLVGEKFNVLDHGHVILLDWMGSDEDVVDAARTSYQGGTKKTSDNRTLIRYLFRNRHSTPMECCVVKFHIKLPIFVERQFARHRTAGWSEVSGRYSELPEEFYVPTEESVCSQSTTNKQGRGDSLDQSIAKKFQQESIQAANSEFALYKERLEDGVARELARINLPLSAYTEKVWWISLHNLIHFLGLRMHSHAQKEIRDYATVIGEQIIAKLFPLVWEAFNDYHPHMGGMLLSSLDIKAMQNVSYTWMLPATKQSFLDHHGIPDWAAEKCRERDEFLEKMTQMGLVLDSKKSFVKREFDNLDQFSIKNTGEFTQRNGMKATVSEYGGIYPWKWIGTDSSGVRRRWNSRGILGFDNTKTSEFDIVGPWGSENESSLSYRKD